MAGNEYNHNIYYLSDINKKFANVVDRGISKIICEDFNLLTIRSLTYCVHI